MEKCGDEEWTVIEVPKSLYGEMKRGARLKGCAPEQFIIEAIEHLLEEEKRKKS